MHLQSYGYRRQKWLSIHITLRVGYIVVVYTIIFNRHWLTVDAVGKDQGVAADGHLGECSPFVGISVGSAAIGALCAHTTSIVGAIKSKPLEPPLISYQKAKRRTAGAVHPSKYCSVKIRAFLQYNYSKPRIRCQYD